MANKKLVVQNNKKNNNFKETVTSFADKMKCPEKKMVNLSRELIGENGTICVNLSDIINGFGYFNTATKYGVVRVRSVQVVSSPKKNAKSKLTYLNLDQTGEINEENIGLDRRSKIIDRNGKRPVFNFRLLPIFKNNYKINGWIPINDFLSVMKEIFVKIVSPFDNNTIYYKVMIRLEFRNPRDNFFRNKIILRQTPSDLKINNFEDSYQKRFTKEEVEKIKIEKKEEKKVKNPVLEDRTKEKKEEKVEPSPKKEMKEIGGKDELSDLFKKMKNRNKNKKKKEKKKEKKLVEKNEKEKKVVKTEPPVEKEDEKEQDPEFKLKQNLFTAHKKIMNLNFNELQEEEIRCYSGLLSEFGGFSIPINGLDHPMIKEKVRDFALENDEVIDQIIDGFVRDYYNLNEEDID